MVRAAAVEEHALATVAAAERIERTAAEPTAGESGQQMNGIDVPCAVVRGCRRWLRTNRALIPVRRSRTPAHCASEMIRSSGASIVTHSRPGRAVCVLPAPLVALPCLVPDDQAAVQRPLQDFMHGGRCPAGRPPLLRPWGQRAFLVQQLGNPRVAGPLGAELEDPAHDRRFGLIDPSLDVRPLPSRPSISTLS